MGFWKNRKAFLIIASELGYADKNDASKKMQSKRNAVIYTRVSTKEQADTNQSLETQKKYCLQIVSSLTTAIPAVRL
jgi:predicted site-specific integrase-resolvase